MNASLLKAITDPASVAIIGASDSATKLQSRPMRFLLQHGYGGNIYPVNPARSTVLGHPAFAAISDLPGAVDHAYILLNTDAAIEAVKACGIAGIKVVTVLADGFAEAGDAGRERQARLVAAAHEAGILLIGPNSTGLVDTRSGFSCTTNAAFATSTLKPGRLAVISQSGSLIGTVYSRGVARGLAFSTLVSVGNEAACGVGELGELLLDDPGTDGFLLFMETVRQPERLAAFARRAHRLGKPVVCYMIGRSSEGQALSVSHTGAMTGSAQAVSSFLKAHGIREVDNFETLLEAPIALIAAQQRPARRRSVTVVSTTGGGGAMVIDRLGERGVSIAGCSAAARATLSAQKIPLGHGKLVDVTLAGARYESMKEVVSTLIHDPETGVLVVAIGSSAQFQPEIAVKPIIDAAAQAAPGAAPVLAFPLPQADASLQLLTEAGIPAFRTLESCAETIAMVLDDAAPEPMLEHASANEPNPIKPLIDQTLANLGLSAADACVLNEVQAGAVFQALGIERPPQHTFSPPGTAADLGGLEFPVVAKLVSADLPHKSEVGALSMGLADAEKVTAAILQMQESVLLHVPNAAVKSVLVQSMQRGVAEILIGLTRDPLVGPVVTVGMGGTATEIYRDTTVRPAPVNPATATAMLQSLVGFPLLNGFRGRPIADLQAAAQAVVAVSQLAHHPAIAEAEINPLLVREKNQGAVLLDALIRLQPTETDKLPID